MLPYTRRQVLEAIRIDLDGQQVSVASPKTLFRMKKGTVRPKDWGDAEALRRFRALWERRGLKPEDVGRS
jgi:hypothetical protein